MRLSLSLGSGVVKAIRSLLVAVSVGLGASLFLMAGVPTPSAASPTTGAIRAVGAENEYANVLSQIGGRYVKVSSILNNPNTDPHTFEASTSVAQEVSQA